MPGDRPDPPDFTDTADRPDACAVQLAVRIIGGDSHGQFAIHADQ
jgi:hypothetical protein